MVAEKTSERLTLEQCAEYGVEDYTEQFTKSDGKNDLNTEVFGDLLHQDETVKSFTRALALNRRGILNLGEQGTGKSTLINGLETALRKLEAGEEIKGEYADAVKGLYERLQAIPRGNIVSFWNPVDQLNPIIFRMQTPEGQDNPIMKIGTESEKWFHNLASEVSDVIREYMLKDYAMSSLQHYLGEGYALARETEATQLVIGFRRGNYIVKLNQEHEDKEEIERIFNSGFKVALKNLLNVTETREEAYQLFKEALSKGLEDVIGYASNSMNEPFKESIRNVVKRHVETFGAKGAEWQESYPVVAKWYHDVAEVLGKTESIEYIVSQFMTKPVALMDKRNIEMKPSIPGRKIRLLIGESFTDIRLGSQAHRLEDLLIPDMLWEDTKPKKLIIRTLGYFEAEELFPAIKRENMMLSADYAPTPVHALIAPGLLATTQLLIFDDGIRELFANPMARGPLLTYLQEGRVMSTGYGIQMTIENPGFIIANETDFPFMTQRFEGQEPEYDGGMHRRFSVVEWPSHAPHSAKTIDKFPAIMRRVSNDMKGALKAELGIAPEAMNLLYQHQLLDTNSMGVVSLKIGHYLRQYEELFVVARGNKHTEITAEDVLEFFWTKRDGDLEAIFTKQYALSYHHKPSKYEIGKVQGLAVSGHGVGRPFPINTILTGKLGAITSIDTNADLTDEMHDKGIALAEAWINSTFGPVPLEIKVLYSNYGHTGGPSASAAQTYALMSRLGNIQVKQDFFVTGTLSDQEGHIGEIGGVYTKVRGAYKTMQEVAKQRGIATMPVNGLIPRDNAPEFLREALFDKELQDAMERKELNVYVHDTIWDGFEILTGGVKQARYKKTIEENIERLSKKAAVNAYDLRNGGHRR